MIDIHDDLYKDIEAIRRIEIVPTMLEVICHTTGMGFAAVARVTKDRWLACSVRDEVQFGLQAGGELKIATTICNEIRDSREPVIIDHVDADERFKNHHTPKMYGLQSYISFPIILKSGEFFGTLCAIDSKPAKVNNPKIIGTFKMFAELLSFHLQSLDVMDRSYNATLELDSKNKILTKVNHDLDNFVYTAAHDLKSPISNIEGLIHILSDSLANEEFDRNEIKQIIGLLQTSVNRFSTTIQDLTTIIRTQEKIDEEKSERINIVEMVEDVKMDIGDLISQSNAQIKVLTKDDPSLHFSKRNFKSILYNLISNAIKYRSPHRIPEIAIKIETVEEKIHFSVQDNGLGISAENKNKIFTMFKRLHNHVEGTGIGLYLVKKIVDNQNGKIEVDSVLGEGSTITIIF